MKIAYLTSEYPAVPHTFIRDEIGEIEALGHSVTRISIRRPGDLVDEQDFTERAKTAVVFDHLLGMLWATVCVCLTRPVRLLKAVQMLIGMKRTGNRSWVQYIAYLLEACWIWRQFDWSRIDHLHVHFGTNPTDVAVMLNILGDVPFSFTVHGPTEFDDPIGYNVPLKIERAKFVIAITDYTRAQLQRWSDPDQWRKIEVVRCSVGRRFILRRGSGVPDNRTFVCVGRLTPQKGHITLLEAVKLVVYTGEQIKLVLAGDGEFRPQIERRIRELGLEHVVRITGWIDGPTVHRELTDARALVLASSAEGQPMVIREAMAQERPVIATYIAGIPELIRPGESGWLVPAGNPEKLAQAMCEVLRTPVYVLETMGQAGRATMLSLHNPFTQAEKLSRIFEEHCVHKAERQSPRSDGLVCEGG